MHKTRIMTKSSTMLIESCKLSQCPMQHVSEMQKRTPVVKYGVNQNTQTFVSNQNTFPHALERLLANAS
jgi:hypothetical protein